MKKPSVLFINRVYAPAKGATGRMLSDLAQGFVQDGWDVNVLTTGSKSSRNSEEGVSVHRIKASSKQNVLNYLWIWLRLLYAGYKFPKTDMIVTMTDPPLLVVVGRLISRKKKSVHIHWCQDVYPDLLPVLDIKFPAFLMKRLRQMSLRALRTCGRIVAIGKCMEKRLGGLEFDHRRLTMIPNWADRELRVTDHPQQFHPDIKLGDNVKLDKPLMMNTQPKFRVLYAGNIGRAHPTATILDATAILQISNPEIEFMFIGEGEAHDQLAAERARRGLENVRLLPTQPKFKLREMMQGGDLHLISMKHDAVGMLVPSKLYSALAAERPCILVGPEESETGRVLMDYRAGSVISQGEPGRLAEEILAYRMDGSKWFEAHKGAKRGAEDFAAETSIKNWIACARATIRYPAN